MNRVLFLIDGFNVYHALAKKYRQYLWLDYMAFASCFIQSNERIMDVLYFTAYTPWNPSKRNRHQNYVRALKKQNVKPIFGKYRKVDKNCRLCKRTYQTYEEKRTDVNIAIHLFSNAMNNNFDTAYLVTGDSDLIPAVDAVKLSFPRKKVGLIIPIGKRAEELKQACDFHMKMKEHHLRTSQLPDKIILDPKTGSTLQRPSTWT